MSKVDLIVPKNANSFPNIQTELRHVKEAIEENQGGDEDLKKTVAKHENELFEIVPGSQEKRSKKANISDVENIQQDVTNIQQDVDFLKNNVNFQDGLVTSYIINQSGDVQNRLTEDMIENHVASMLATEKTYINGNYEFIDVIARIRAHSHLYIGKYNENSDVLEIKQVSDADKTKYADGSDIEWTYIEDETTKYYNIDLFMKLPEFWWKCEEVATDVYKVSFSMDSDFVDNTWHHWEGDTFIGVYEAIIDDGKCYSRKDVTPTVNQSWNQFTGAATAKTNNENVPYRIVSYESHQIMCLLGYGWLANTDAQVIVGRGSTNHPKTTGLCDSKGMVDTEADVDGGSSAGTSTNVSINFWGLENWWGDIAEWIDNIRTENSSGLINVYDYKAHTVVRTIQNGVVEGNEITKLFLGTDGDVTPISTISNSNYNRAFADYGSVYAAAGYVALRSGIAAYLYGGLGFLNVGSSASSVHAYLGSRLLYKGNYIIVDSFSV